MNFPKWAPVGLVEYYNSFTELESLELINDKQMIFRLITRPEMESVWSWVEKQDMCLPLMSNGGMVGRFLNALESFEKTAKLPASERVQDFNEIQQLASQLYIKLDKYKGETHAFNQYAALIPECYDAFLVSSLKETYQQKLIDRKKSRHETRFPFWNSYLPPISELLKQLSLAAKKSDSELSKIFPTKIKQNSALNTYLVNVFYNSHLLVDNGDYPPSIVATFISVALDDATVTADKVRKIRGTFQEKD